MILSVKGEWGRQGEGEAKTVSRDDILRGPVPSMIWDATALLAFGIEMGIQSQS
tara:strand:+ start:865 stop:1026 length:162 start_codon:yes stop_codon:yes gene_type:complete